MFVITEIVHMFVSVAFVAAYCVALLVCVLPIMVMEFAIGQLTGQAPVKALYNICPLFKGKFLLFVSYVVANS